MATQFAVKGVSPLGRIVKLAIVADTAEDAKAKAEEQGLKFVVVKEGASPDAPPAQPQRPEP
jgi:type II secretory pathway component PulF